MLRWVTDQAWVSWSYLSLNSRKALYRLRGARGRTPCQSSSDSGKAHQTRCEACFVVKDPRRFQAVCPVLKIEKGDVPICGVNAEEIRPFWGRAAAYYGRILLAAYLVAVCGGFIGLRSLGYRVSPATVAWPPHWNRITLARADYFYQKGIQAYKDHDVQLSLLALTEAYQLAPGRDEEGALLLAQLMQITWPPTSNDIYARLVAGNGPLAPVAVQAWARALLARGDLAGLANLAAARLASGDGLAPVWTHALIFEAETTGDWSLVQGVVDGQAPVPADCREVLKVRLKCQGESAPTQVARLELTLEKASTSFERFELLETLIDLGQATAVLSFVQEDSGRLASRERVCVLLDAAAAGHWEDLRQKEFQSVLGEPTSETLVNLLVGHLIRYPDPGLIDALFQRLDLDSFPATASHYGASNALLCLAGVEHSEARLDTMIQKLRAASGTRSASLTYVKEYFLTRSSTVPVAQYLPAVQPLSLEVSYALLRRFPGNPGGSATPGGRRQAGAH